MMQSARDVVATIIIGLFVVAIAAAAIGGCVYDRERDRAKEREKRVLVEQCLRDPARSAVDCQVAVYGHVGRY